MPYQPIIWYHQSQPRSTSCTTTDVIADGGFEQPLLPYHVDARTYGPRQTDPWRTNDPTGQILIVNGNQVGLPAAEGAQFSQVSQAGSTYQDFSTTPGQILLWSVQIRSRDLRPTDADSIQVHFGAPDQTTGGFTYTDSAEPDEWTTLSGWYRVPDGQHMTRLDLSNLADGEGDLIDDASVAAVHC